jgi:hypothetical protein
MKTGWPPGLLQDDDRKLSSWFASRPDARYQLRKNMKEDTKQGKAMPDKMRTDPPINATDFGLPAEFAEKAENYARWAVEAEREAYAKAMHAVGLSEHISKIAEAMRARGQDPMPLFDDWPGGFK